MGLQTSTGAGMVDSTFNDAQVVTPSDTISPATRLSDVRGIWADTSAAATVKVITNAVAQAGDRTGSAVTAAQGVSFVIPAGSVLPLAVAYVLATGTTATGLKAFY